MARKCIFITGGASGIGRAVAVKFGAQGWFVGLADVNEVGMRETAALIPSGRRLIVEMSSRYRMCLERCRCAARAFLRSQEVQCSQRLLRPLGSPRELGAVYLIPHV